MKKILIFLNVIFILFLGCNRENDRIIDSEKTRIALVLKTLNSPFFIDLKSGAEEAADQLNIELIVQAPEREIDVEKQMQIIENLIQTRVDVICVSPSGSKELIPAIAKANRAKIPVIIVDTGIDEAAAKKEGVKFATFIGSDNYQGGKIAGEYIAKLYIENVNVAVLEGIPGHETGDSRLRGFRDGIKNFTHVKVVASQPANWERDQGYNVMQNILQAHPDIQAVFACNDMMALGAIEAVRAAGMSNQIKIVGFDAIEEARKEIAANNLEASIAQNPAEMGRLAIATAVKILKNEPVPPHIPVKIELITLASENHSSD